MSVLSRQTTKLPCFQGWQDIVDWWIIVICTWTTGILKPHCTLARMYRFIFWLLISVIAYIVTAHGAESATADVPVCPDTRAWGISTSHGTDSSFLTSGRVQRRAISVHNNSHHLGDSQWGRWTADGKGQGKHKCTWSILIFLGMVCGGGLTNCGSMVTHCMYLEF